MAKERFLTVFIPIKDSDAVITSYATRAALRTAIPPTLENIYIIYKLTDGTYERVWRNPSSGLIEYHTVVDREFPYLDEPLNIYDFTYEATRMGTAPNISAQGVMSYAKKDASGNDVTLDGLWTQECHVLFNGEKFYLKQIPTSSKTNEDARYKYDMDFVAERVILERVYLYDVVSPFITERPISENSTFSLYGDVNELVKRINASLIRSGLTSLVRKYVPYSYDSSKIVPYLTYEQWNSILVNPLPLIGDVFSDIADMVNFRTFVYLPLNGDYNLYLQQYIYENTSGDFTTNGYKVVLGIDKYGANVTTEEKMLSFENNTIYEALQQFYETFELQYYVTSEKDSSGNFTGNTLIVVGDCEHDFADWDSLSGDYIRDNEGIPTTANPFDYGVTNELLSKEKTNTTEKIVTRITGVGSSENVPWYYPNPCSDGWIKPLYTRSGVELQEVTVDYPVDEGSTTADSVRYEKFLKNRIGKAIIKGKQVGVTYANGYKFKYEHPESGDFLIDIKYEINLQSYTLQSLPCITLNLDYNPNASGCSKVVASLACNGEYIYHYDSSQTYQEPDNFQNLFLHGDGSVYMSLLGGAYYNLDIEYVIPINDVPLSKQYDFDGYHYPSVTLPVGQTGYNTHAGENFYNLQDLQPFLTWAILGQTTPVVYDAGYSINGESSGKVAPVPRREGSRYKDLSTGRIYVCTDSEQPSYDTTIQGTHIDAFDANPLMLADEWLNTFVTMALRLYLNNGWYLDGNRIQLEDYGLELLTQGGIVFSSIIFDKIEFQRLKWVTPQSNLMPEVYIKTDGERRFYNANNYYPLQTGTADTAIGEEQVGSDVRNPLYKENETDTDDKHYEFESEYVQSMPHEHIENFDDVKPTIKEQTNTVNGNVLRIDVVEEFAYDKYDDDNIWENNSDGSIQGEYKHPYFFAKLRPMGFNIFDMALQNDMVLSMTTGNCGACNFKIGVDENYGKNPVQLWEYDVYDGDNLQATKLYDAGTLRRYVDLTGLYYNKNGFFEKIQVSSNALDSGEMPFGYDNNKSIYHTYNYTGASVESGMVGVTKKSGSVHLEGDVVASGRFIDSQQDTSENYVWVALFKDTETYGTIMPSAMPDYNNNTLNRYIEPKGINYINRITGQTSTLTEDQADKFVLTNIKLPQVYLRRAEHKLSHELVKYMYENNYQKFNFSIKFSRIYLAENQTTDENLNENSVLYCLFNRHTYRQYVKHYTYKMSHGESLPEIFVDLNEELSDTKTIYQQWDSRQKANNKKLMLTLNSKAKQSQDKIERRSVSKDGNQIMSGNITIQGKSTSLVELTKGSDSQWQNLEWEEF